MFKLEHTSHHVTLMLQYSDMFSEIFNSMFKKYILNPNYIHKINKNSQSKLKNK